MDQKDQMDQNKLTKFCLLYKYTGIVAKQNDPGNWMKEEMMNKLDETGIAHDDEGTWIFCFFVTFPLKLLRLNGEKIL